MTRNELEPPAPDEIEVSVFGPGYGESTVIHIGEGQWVIVDSCQQKGVDLPAPLDYLLKLGVNTQTAVKLIVATHWHDDHIRGMSKIVNACNVAPFVCSAALAHQEFQKVAALSQSMMGSSMSKGADEIGAVFNSLVQRRNSMSSGKYKIQFPIVKRAAADQLLFKQNSVAIWSLSPSDAAISQAIASISTLSQNTLTTLTSIPDLRPNHASVVLWLKIGEHFFLLGGDLEVTNGPDAGWLAVFTSPLLDEKADFFKIPHHGSHNGDHDSIWSQLLTQDPHAILTPYRRGRHFLPTDTDISRLLTRTPHVYLTAPPSSKKPKLRGVVKQHVDLMTQSMTEYYSGWGHVRLRQKINERNQWQVDLFGDAYHLTAT